MLITNQTTNLLVRLSVLPPELSEAAELANVEHEEENPEMNEKSLETLEIEKTRFQKKPLRVEVYLFLKEAITQGRLKPGEKLNEINLGDRLGISRTPIREALMHLEREGLVSIDPGKGAVVSEINSADIKLIYPIKAVLEGLAAGLAKLNSRDIADLKKLNKQLREIAREGDVNRYMEVNARFHQVFVGKCSNQRLCDLISSYNSQIRVFTMFCFNRPHRMKKSVEEHDAIIKAFAKQDSRLAERLVREHVEQGVLILEEVSEPKGAEHEE